MTPTPLELASEQLSGRPDVYLKREDTHELGAFKWRAALPVVAAYRDRGAQAVVTASTGNHGAATAWAATRAGVEAIVFAPESASRVKRELIERLGGRIELAAGDFDETKTSAARFAAEHDLPFFEDGAEPLQYEAYRAIAGEILAQLPRPPAAVVVPVGNGALLGGIGLELCEHSPGTARIGVQSSAAPVMTECWREGKLVESTRADTFADGLAVRVAIPLAVDVLGEVATDMMLVDESEVARAVGDYATAGIRAEGAAAAALAALRRLGDVDGPVVLVVTGRNIDDETWRRACDDPESFQA